MRAFGKAEGGFAPTARVADLVTTDAAGETVVYDTAVHHIHHLNGISATIWRLCDGRRSVEALARDATRDYGAAIDEAAVHAALTKLEAAALLEGPLPVEMRTRASSRRSLLKRVAAASAVPMIASMSAPTAAMASSEEQCVNAGMAPNGTICFTGTQCCSNVCDFAPGEGRQCRPAAA